ncbi:MAG: DUF3575 domain-containing protein [Bacteroidia bacterium]|nr:DUF3575 domain-containing protein [Bacteroidia bacterium]
MKRWLTICMLAIPLLGSAQEESPAAIAAAWAFKWSPLHLLNYYPTAQFAVERRLKSNYSVVIDGGLVIKNLGDNPDESGFDKSGYKLKVEPRYYFFSPGEHVMNFFLAPEFYVNHVDYKRSATYGKNCDEFGQCDYFQLETYRMQYREKGINFKVGVSHIFSSRLMMEYWLGVAYRDIAYKQVDFPDGTQYLTESAWISWEPTEETRTVIRPTMSFRIGYAIR